MLMSVKDRQIELFKVVMDILAERGPLSIYAIAKEASKKLGEDMHKVRMRIMRLIHKLETLGMVKVTRGPRNAKLVDLHPKGLDEDIQHKFYMLLKPRTLMNVSLLSFYYERAIIRKLVRDGLIPRIALKMPKLTEKILGAIKKSLEIRESECEAEFTSDADAIAYNEILDWMLDIMNRIDMEEVYNSTLNLQSLKRRLIAIFKEADLTERDIRLLSHVAREQRHYLLFSAKIYDAIHEALNELKRESAHEC